MGIYCPKNILIIWLYLKNILMISKTELTACAIRNFINLIEHKIVSVLSPNIETMSRFIYLTPCSQIKTEDLATLLIILKLVIELKSQFIILCLSASYIFSIKKLHFKITFIKMLFKTIKLILIQKMIWIIPSSKRKNDPKFLFQTDVFWDKLSDPVKHPLK